MATLKEQLEAKKNQGFYKLENPNICNECKHLKSDNYWRQRCLLGGFVVKYPYEYCCKEYMPC